MPYALAPNFYSSKKLLKKLGVGVGCKWIELSLCFAPFAQLLWNQPPMNPIFGCPVYRTWLNRPFFLSFFPGFERPVQQYSETGFWPASWRHDPKVLNQLQKSGKHCPWMHNADGSTGKDWSADAGKKKPFPENVGGGTAKNYNWTSNLQGTSKPKQGSSLVACFQGPWFSRELKDCFFFWSNLITAAFTDI